MTIDFDADVRFPTRASDWVETLLIGSLLLLFSGFVLPLLPVYGHLVQVARAGMAGDSELPPFTDWETLFVDGLKGLVVTVVYQIPPFLVGVGSVVALFVLGSGSDRFAGAGILVFVLGTLVATLLGLVFGYLGAVGFLSFAADGDVRAAFDLDLLKRVALNREYAVSWGYGVVLLFVANLFFGMFLFAVNIVAIVPIIGIIIGLLALFVVVPVGTAMLYYTQLVIFRIWGRGYASARNLDAGAVSPRIGSDDTGVGGARSPESSAVTGSQTAADNSPGTAIGVGAGGATGTRSSGEAGGEIDDSPDAGVGDDSTTGERDNWR